MEASGTVDCQERLLTNNADEPYINLSHDMRHNSR